MAQHGPDMQFKVTAEFERENGTGGMPHSVPLFSPSTASAVATDVCTAVTSRKQSTRGGHVWCRFRDLDFNLIHVLRRFLQIFLQIVAVCPLIVLLLSSCPLSTLARQKPVTEGRPIQQPIECPRSQQRQPVQVHSAAALPSPASRLRRRQSTSQSRISIPAALSAAPACASHLPRVVMRSHEECARCATSHFILLNFSHLTRSTP